MRVAMMFCWNSGIIKERALNACSAEIAEGASRGLEIITGRCG